MEKQNSYYEYGKENKTKCEYDLVVDGCRQCLFETLCRLEHQKNTYNI